MEAPTQPKLVLELDPDDDLEVRAETDDTANKTTPKDSALEERLTGIQRLVQPNLGPKDFNRFGNTD